MRTLSEKQLQNGREYRGWEDHMIRAIVLARMIIAAHPNPRVGCVLARSGEGNADDHFESEIIGEGRHRAAGEPHAEAVALQAARDAGHSTVGCTAFVSLEPCCSEGRTGACTDALIEAGVARVVIAGEDPNPAVAGAGVRQLEEAGIKVFKLQHCTTAAEALNPGYMKRHREGAPFVRCKLAMSLDGRTAAADGRVDKRGDKRVDKRVNKENRWITGPAARADVQRLRAGSSVVITGIGTVLADDPRLDVRPAEIGMDPLRWELNLPALQRQPLRVILDSHLRTPPNAKMLKVKAPLRIYCSEEAASPSKEAAALHKKAAIHPLPLQDGKLPLRAVLESLFNETHCNEALIEAGPTLAGAFVSEGLVDELIIYMAPKLLGNDALPLMHLPPLACLSNAPKMRYTGAEFVGDDIKLKLTPI